MNYVLLFIRQADDFVLIEKQKPEWQKGRLNLPGGKVEQGEEPQDAAVRELKEETGMAPIYIQLMGKVTGEWGCIWCYYIIPDNIKLEPNPDEIEKVFWSSFDAVKENPLLLPNLKVMIPLMLSKAKDWVIIDDEDSNLNQPHRMVLTV